MVKIAGKIQPKFPQYRIVYAIYCRGVHTEDVVPTIDTIGTVDFGELTAILRFTIGDAEVVAGEVGVGMTLPVELVQVVECGVEKVVLRSPGGEFGRHAGDRRAQPIFG